MTVLPADPGDPAAATQTKPRAVNRAAGRAIRVLLVDDHRMLRESLGRSLARDGFEIVGEAADGMEALERVAAVAPDVVLMDVTMPRMDGVEATRAIHEAHPEMRILMLTMHADLDVLSSAIGAGAVGYLVKDCSTSEVAKAVRMAASDDATLSPRLAASMLAEVRKIDAPSAADGDRLITKREEEVLQRIADGCSTPQVAERMFISQKTVKNHLASIYQKLDARDRTQAVLQAVRMGIVKLS